MHQPTQQQISEAKAYIRRRVEAELSMKNNLDTLLRIASKRLSALAMEYKMSVKQAVSSSNPAIRKRIGQIIDWLLFMINDYVDTLAVATHEDDKDIIIPYIKREQYGKTFDDRLTTYVNDYIYNSDASRSPAKALTLLTTFAVTEGWMKALGLNAFRNHAKGFFSFRGSSYPCGLCDSMTGYHPIEEYTGAWHPHCKCYFIFV